MNGLQCLTVNDKTIDDPDKVKNLGVIVDKHLILNDQVNEIVRNARFS